MFLRFRHTLTDIWRVKNCVIIIIIIVSSLRAFQVVGPQLTNNVPLHDQRDTWVICSPWMISHQQECRRPVTLDTLDTSWWSDWYMPWVSVQSTMIGNEPKSDEPESVFCIYCHNVVETLEHSASTLGGGSSGRRQGSPKRSAVTVKNFVGHIVKYAVFGLKPISKFSSQMSSYTPQKFHLGRTDLSLGRASPASSFPLP